MCRVLQLNRSTYYYESKQIQNHDEELTAHIIEIFQQSRNNYGTRKIKVELKKLGYTISRRRIGRIMKREGLVSNYTVAQYKAHKSRVNETEVANVLNREFNNHSYRNVVVSDLTYVRVGGSWNYICVLVDLFNREIIGYSAGAGKDALLVKEAFTRISGNLKDINIFHTDRGKEFDNKIIEDTLRAFGISRSLSHKGCPYDNAVAEATFKVVKTEFVNNYIFESTELLKLELADYVNWFNNHRIHSSLDYYSPVEYRKLYRL